MEDLGPNDPSQDDADDADNADDAPDVDDELADDVFDDQVFDESFVAAAAVIEPTAAERQKALRESNLRRLLKDGEAQQDNLRHEYRRLAPLSDDDGSGLLGRARFRSGSGDRTVHSGLGTGGDFEDWPDDYWPYGTDHEDYPLWLSRRRRRRNRRIMTVVSVVVVVAVVCVYALSQFFTGLSLKKSTSAAEPKAESPSTLDTTSAVYSAVQNRPPEIPDLPAELPTRPTDWPPRGKWAATPIGTPPPVPAGGGPHAFLDMQADGKTPVAFDPCRVIHYVTGGTSEAPTGADRLLKDAIRTVSQLTGLVFVDDGNTDERPDDNRKSYQPDRYGKRWAPVLISWSTAEESPRLSKSEADGAPPGSTVDVLGYAESVSAGSPINSASAKESSRAGSDTNATAPISRIYVTGSVVLDRDDFATMLGSFDGYAKARATVLHELGHLVGLDHVDDKGQLMAPTLSGALTEFAAGDRQGLATLGTGVCVPQI